MALDSIPPSARVASAQRSPRFIVVMIDPNIEPFYRDFGNALQERVGAIFAGAGLSVPSGYANWRELLRGIAKDLGLDIDRESDLIAIAQYHVNDRTHRKKLTDLLVSEFTKDAKITENHRLLASLPIDTVWTTNYDILIEEAFREAGKRPDVKWSVDNLTVTLPRRDVVIYKMHGDISAPHDAVLTKEDYETYNETREAFSIKLRGDLIEKTFLFLGFSFTDPNIDYVFSRIRALLGRNTQEHYCVMLHPKSGSAVQTASADYEYQMRKLELRKEDLKRYGIRSLVVGSHDEVTGLLRELNRRSHMRDILVSCSADDYLPLGRQRLEGLAWKIGWEVIQRGFNLITGIGVGIGSNVLLGAIEALYRGDERGGWDRVLLRPFPRVSSPELKPIRYSEHRRRMVSQAGFSLFLARNRDGQDSKGVIEEYKISRELGKYIIPIGASGHAARVIWKEVKASLREFYPTVNIDDCFDALGDSRNSDETLIEAAFKIIKRVSDA